jgi:glucokinase
MSIYIGCDLGGTNIKAGLVDLSKKVVLESRTIPTLSHQGQDPVLERMGELISSLMDWGRAKNLTTLGAGISAPGTLDLRSGEVVFLTNFPGQWRGVQLKSRIEALAGIPVSLLNDVRAITYGEYSFGAGKGSERMACYAIGTGVGGGLVLNDQLVLGFHGTAGELGHQTVEINGLRCGCGNHGCLEVYTSGPAIASRAEKAVRQGFKTLIADLVNHDLNLITPKIVAQAAEAGDQVAREIWRSVGEYLGIGIANTCVSFGPEKVVISGGVAAAGDLLLDPIRKTLAERVFVMPIELVEIVTGSLGSDAGVLGMASWAAAPQSKF